MTQSMQVLAYQLDSHPAVSSQCNQIYNNHNGSSQPHRTICIQQQPHRNHNPYTVHPLHHYSAQGVVLYDCSHNGEQMFVSATMHIPNRFVKPHKSGSLHQYTPWWKQLLCRCSNDCFIYTSHTHTNVQVSLECCVPVIYAVYQNSVYQTHSQACRVGGKRAWYLLSAYVFNCHKFHGSQIPPCNGGMVTWCYDFITLDVKR